MEKTMKKDKPPKRPRGRQPSGAILVDGKWQLTELSTQLYAERVLRHREMARIRWRAQKELLRIAHPELFVVKGMDPRQTMLAPVRPTERNGDLPLCQKSDTRSTATDDASSFWRSVQRDDGTPSLSSGAAPL